MKGYFEILIMVATLVGGVVISLLLALGLLLIFTGLFGTVHGFFVISSLISGFVLAVFWVVYYGTLLTRK